MGIGGVRTGLVIPALNEERAIVQVVTTVMPYGLPIVVDDGSTDATARLAKAAGATVVSHPRNKGYDAALESGLLRATELGLEYAITMDGDGQHRAETLDLFQKALDGGADLVIGVRDRHQRFSESLFAQAGRLRWGLADPLCGLKGYRLALLAGEECLNSYESIGTELALRAARAGWRIAQVPVPTRPRIGSSRFGTGMKANWRILKALGIGLWRSWGL